MSRTLILATILILSFNWAQAAERKKVWIYTSIYKEFATPLKEAFDKKFPQFEAEIFQGGSEKLQGKVEAELISKRLQADLLLTSDPFWSYDLSQRQLVLKRDRHHDVETNYYSLMVLICHKDFAKDKRPDSFKDLTKPEYKDIVQLGSPLESGTTFATVAYLSDKYGWDYFKKLRANNLASSGGNSTVIQKVETGEKKVGVVLLENALAAVKRGSPIEVIYPTDGSIPIPSAQVIFKDAINKDGAQAFADFVLSQEGQQILRGGYMYSVRNDVQTPEGAKPFKEVLQNSKIMSPEFMLNVAKNSKNIKKQFSQIVLQ